MDHQTRIMFDKAMWRKANIAAAATMGGASTSAFIRAATHAALTTLAEHDPKLATAFQLIDEDESERRSGGASVPVTPVERERVDA